MSKRKIAARGVIRVEVKMPPVVELDSEAHAAYVRVSPNAVACTEVVDNRKCIVTIDRDEHGDAVGIELVGVDIFNIETLLKKAKVSLSKTAVRRTSYVPAALPA